MASTSSIRRRRIQLLPPTSLLLIAAIGTLSCSTRSHGFLVPPSRHAQPTFLTAVQVDPRKTRTQTEKQRTFGRDEERCSVAGALWELNEYQIRCNGDEQEANESGRSGGGDARNNKEDSAASDSNGSENEDENVSNNNKDQQARSEKARKMAARAALLGSRTGGSRSSAQKKSSRTPSKTTTSVGERRVGSASKARQQGQGMQKRLMDALRKSASSNTVDTDERTRSPEDDDTKSSSSSETKASCSTATNTPTSKDPKKLSSSGIHETIVELMERQMRQRMEEKLAPPPEVQMGWGNGYFGWERQQQDLVHQNMPSIPRPGKILIHPSSKMLREAKLQFPDCLTVRVATSKEDMDVANLRLSVFSNFSPEVRQQLIHRSARAVVHRRRQGATCIVATVPPSITARKRNRSSHVILGSAECSFHEFDNTLLGKRRLPQSILYITEVAVSPNARRRGIGGKLLEAIDILGEMRGIETLYLHVDVENTAAADMYEKKGYQKVDNWDPMYMEFTTKLNLHDGATKGRRHFLMYKNLVTCPVWLPSPPTEERKETPSSRSSSQVASKEFPQPTGTLGFEVPC